MFKKLYQKARKGVLVLPFIVGLAPKLEARPDGFLELSAQYTQFTGDNFFKEVYGNAFGGSIGLGINFHPFVLGGKLTFLTGSGDYEKERSFTQETSNTQTLSIVGLEPYIGLSGSGDVAPFINVGYGNYYFNDQLRKQRESWFKSYDYPDSYKDNISGLFVEGGAKVNLNKISDSKIDAAIRFAVGTRNASPIKGPYFSGGVEFKF